MTARERLLEDFREPDDDPRDRWNDQGDEDIDCPVCHRSTDLSELAHFGRCYECAEREVGR